MAEDAILREAIAERLLEGIDLIDPLADEGPFSKQVLIRVRHGACVGIDAGFAGVEPGVTRAVGAGEADGHPRLQNPVPRSHALCRRIVLRTIERMGHGGHELPRGIARQLGIRIERDHIFHRGQDVRLSDDRGKPIRRPAAQEPVQVRQFASLPLVSHPEPLMGIPATRAMEEKKRVAIFACIFGVQRIDACSGRQHQLIVTCHRLLVGILEIREQGKV